eukprot:TRINITY_DN2124_c0_g1_i1.p1 TRINITY_DN2124_c0_g1~~TRINITY_DN2124_c0_g1_i1.p1  ORF type:complete len:912 (+),score=211.69 TRINITY_DN2124_c0_g1_i1:56-2791(+)
MGSDDELLIHHNGGTGVFDDSRGTYIQSQSDPIRRQVIHMGILLFVCFSISILLSIGNISVGDFCGPQSTPYDLTIEIETGKKYLSPCFMFVQFCFPCFMFVLIKFVNYLIKEVPWKTMDLHKLLKKYNLTRPSEVVRTYWIKAIFVVLIILLYDIKLLYHIFMALRSKDQAFGTKRNPIAGLFTDICSLFMWVISGILMYFNFRSGKKHPKFLHIFWHFSIITSTVDFFKYIFDLVYMGRSTVSLYIAGPLFLSNVVMVFVSYFTIQHTDFEKVIVAEEKKQFKIGTKFPWGRFIQLFVPEIPIIIVAVFAAIIQGCLNIFMYEPMTDLQTFTTADAILAGGVGQEDDAKSAVLGLVFQYMGYIFGLGIMAGIQEYCFAFAGARVLRRIRARFMNSVMKQELGFIHNPKFAPGILMQAMSSDSDEISTVLSENLSETIPTLFQVIVGLVQMISISSTLTSLMIALVVYQLAFSLFRSYKVTAQMAMQFAGASAVATGKGAETIQGIEAVRLFLMEDEEKRQFQSKLDDQLSIGIKKTVFEGVCEGVENLLNVSIMGAGLFYGITLVKQTIITTHKLTEFGMITMNMMASLYQLMTMLPMITGAAGAARNVMRVVFREPLIDLSKGEAPKTFSGEIKFEDVVFTYPIEEEEDANDSDSDSDSESESEVENNEPKAQLNHVNLEIPAGQNIAFVGHSGCGKSTTLSLVLGHYHATGPNDSGRVLIDGRDVSKLSSRWLIQQCGVVSQKPLLFNESLRYNVEYGCQGRKVSDDEFWNAVKLAKADDFITPETMNNPVGEGGEMLSGGQRQRVVIARVILRDPKILVLDEITAALDPKSEASVMDAIKEISKNRTCLMVAHRLNTIAHADAIYVYDHGEIIETGNHASLAADNTTHYSELYHQQIGVFSEAGNA